MKDQDKLQWFIDRIGKRVYSEYEDTVILNEQMARYLSNISYEKRITYYDQKPPLNDSTKQKR